MLKQPGGLRESKEERTVSACGERCPRITHHTVAAATAAATKLTVTYNSRFDDISACSSPLVVERSSFRSERIEIPSTWLAPARTQPSGASVDYSGGLTMNAARGSRTSSILMVVFARLDLHLRLLRDQTLKVTAPAFRRACPARPQTPQVPTQRREGTSPCGVRAQLRRPVSRSSGRRCRRPGLGRWPPCPPTWRHCRRPRERT